MSNSNDKPITASTAGSEENPAEDSEDLRRSSRRKRARVNPQVKILIDLHRFNSQNKIKSSS